MFKDKFIQAIRSKKKVRVSFFSQKDKDTLVRTCAPMDYGPKTNTKEKNDRFHVWDYETKNPISLNPEQISDLVVLNETFNPAEFVTWTPNWLISRDWGQYS